MTLPKLAFLVALLVGAAVVSLEDASSETKGERALKDAQASGKVLFGQSWAAGTKTCVTCHARGPNKLTGRRLSSYPRYDKLVGKVITGQQKLNQMIAEKSKGTPLELGSDDLNALEAYVKTLR